MTDASLMARHSNCIKEDRNGSKSKKGIVFLMAFALMFASLSLAKLSNAYAEEDDYSTTLADGEYTDFEYKWEGGTGKARLDLQKIVVSEGKATGYFIASSANMSHAYYLGHTESDIDDPSIYDPETGTCAEGVVPIVDKAVSFPVVLNKPTDIACRTTAMSEPHWVQYNYTITIDEPETESYDEVIAIVHTNDVHGHIEVEPYVKGLADEMKASGEYSLVLTVSGGDIYAGGNAVADHYKGELIPQIVDQIYDVIVPGNNDFPTGVAGNALLTSLYQHTKTICANIQVKDDTDVAAYATTYEPIVGAEDFAAIYDGVSLKEDGSLDYSALNLGTVAKDTSPWEPTAIYITSKGTKLGLFGLTCTGGQVGTFSHSQGTINAAQECVDALKEDGADVIVGIGHVGWMGEGSEAAADGTDGNSWAVANAVQEMDAFIDAHTHSIIGNGYGCYVGENQVLVNQAACRGECIGVMLFFLKEGQVVDKKAQILREEDLDDITPDASIQQIVDDDLERLSKVAGEPVARTPYFLNCERLSAGDPGGSIRGNETNLGDFVTDLILLAYSELLDEEFEFTFMPGFWIRSSVNEGSDITKLELQSVIGYDNTRLRRQLYSAADILKLVTDGLAVVSPQKDGISFNQYSGLFITYTNNNGSGTPITIKVGDTLIYDAWNGGIQVDDSWRVKGIRTLHMDGASVPADDPDIICQNGSELREVFYNYLATHTIGEDYTIYPDTIAPAGRIVEVSDSNQFPDVPEDYTGVAKAIDGNWYYVKDGNVQHNYTGVQSNKYGWWYVENGKVNFNYTGFAANEYGWWYVEKGQVKFNKTDIMSGTVYGEEGWWLVKDSKVSDETTVAQNKYGWWKITEGKVDFEFTGLANNTYGWWYLEKGQVKFNYTGFAENEYGWWYVEKGQVKFNKNDIMLGTVDGEEGWWLVKDGKVSDVTTVAQNKYGWWKITEGKVDFGFTGFADNAYGTWYLEKGQVIFSYTGFFPNDEGWWYVEKGQVTYKKNGIIHGMANDYVTKAPIDGWWYVRGSKVTLEPYTTVAQNEYGWWYICFGQVRFDYNGVGFNEYGGWYIKNGKVDFTFTGTDYGYVFEKGMVVGDAASASMN